MILHPNYSARLFDWEKWRICYAGGTDFVTRYLYKYSSRETASDYEYRKSVAYIPAFAKSAIIEIRNSIFQRVIDVSRLGGPDNYQHAVNGEDEGVDLSGSSMNNFMGRYILDELLLMSRVGIYVDMPPAVGPTLKDAQSVRPYLYWYRIEDIQNWTYNAQRQLKSVYLRDTILLEDDRFYLIKGETTGYRHLYLNDSGTVTLDLYDDKEKLTGTYILNLPAIPFHIADIGQSLMEDVASYQIALLNMGSSDVSYSIGSNFPFYTEQSDNRLGSAHFEDDNSTSTSGHIRDAKSVEVGPAKGRSYPYGAERPAFIHPSSEPLKASMDKQEQLKAEIRQLVHLALSNTSPKYNSAESKSMDNQGLEAGLSNIGLTLQDAENQIAKFWAMYLAQEPAIVYYPKTYDLKTEEERRAEAKEYREMLPVVPSKTYQGAVKKLIATTLLSNKVSPDVLEAIYSEVDSDLGMTADIDYLEREIEMGTISPATASLMLGHKPGEAIKAKEAHLERITRIAEAQTKSQLVNPDSRGVKDLAMDSNTSSDEKKDKEGRGEGRKVDYKKNVR